jgi:hypothetical protein
VLSLNPHPFKKRKGAAPKGRLERERKRLEGPAAVDDVDGAGGVGGFVGGEVDGEGCDFFGLADAADGLAGDEIAPGFFNVAERGDALLEGWRLDGTGANGVDAHSLLDEIDGESLGEADYGGFGGAVDEAIRRAFDAGSAAGHINDAALFGGGHCGDEGAASSIHRLHVKVEGEIPIGFGAIENRALMNEAGAVEENVDGAEFGGESVYGVDVADVEFAGFDRRVSGGEFFEEVFVDVGGEYLGAFAREGGSGGGADALARGGDQCGFSLEAAGGHEWRWLSVICLIGRCDRLLKWRDWRGSNSQPLPSEGSALSS